MARPLLALYPLHPHRYDEMLASDGGVRPHWQHLFSHLDAATPEEMRQRLNFADRRILENGVAYNVYADPDGTDRPWALDPLPLIIPSAEWAQIEAAVAQRARLLNAILGDLYGPRRLLGEGLLPPALVYGQHGYLWPCQGLRPPGDVWLHQYAVDLARSPDGRWWAIADRTQAPSGAGYALENRLIVSRVFPQLFRDLRVQHLADFFRRQREGLAALAPVAGDEQPRIVLLTPGPYNETYFEHVYLARYLGFPLVEGQDLTVRDDVVYLKTLSGLQRVHVILRRLDDDYCDPLELRGESALGVPGLLNAVRAGRVLVANALGSGLLGSGALMGFLPGACERLLGETLAMPSVATWWCGERSALDYVRKHLPQLVIKGAYPTQRLAPVFAGELSAAERGELLRRIEARPHAYVAQEVIELAQAPIWSRSHERRLLARPVGLRVHAVATPDGYAVMPGGLARVGAAVNERVISMQRGGASKDAWVLSDGPVSEFSLLKPSLGVRDLVRTGGALSSRAVENLFWLGRYAERFDACARLLRVALARLVDTSGERTPAVTGLLRLASTLGVIPAAAGDSWPGDEQVLLQAVSDPCLGGGLSCAIRALLRAAGQVRERLSQDHWQVLSRLQRDLQTFAQARQGASGLGESLAFLDGVLAISASLSGFAMDNMTRDDGWRFLMVGRRIERLIFLSRMVADFLCHLDGSDRESMEGLLELADSIITYRSRYSRPPELLPLVDLLVFDASNPHAVAGQIEVLTRYLERLQRELGSPPATLLTQAVKSLQGIPLLGFERTPQAAAQQLAASLEQLADAAAGLSDALVMRHFMHSDEQARSTLAL